MADKVQFNIVLAYPQFLITEAIKKRYLPSHEKFVLIEGGVYQQCLVSK